MAVYNYREITNCTPMQILTYANRVSIETYLSLKQKPKAIAEFLHKDKSVITRELSRNTKSGKPYNAGYAQTLTDQRKQQTRTLKLHSNIVLRDWVIEQLKESFSPDEISGRLKEHPELVPKELRGSSISHEAIYQYIYARENKSFKLWRYLRKKHVVRRPFGSRAKNKKVLIPERKSIHERPEVITLRMRVGDWETDTMIGRGRAALSVQRERKLQLTRIHKVRDKTAEETLEAITKSVESVPKEVFLSLTYDNGSEGTKHTEIRDGYLVDTYFCDPYKSYQKGSIENTNGLIREYFPKGMDFDQLTDEQIQTVEDKLNNRPRKKLGYLTPNEAMNRALKELQLI